MIKLTWFHKRFCPSIWNKLRYPEYVCTRDTFLENCSTITNLLFFIPWEYSWEWLGGFSKETAKWEISFETISRFRLVPGGRSLIYLWDFLFWIVSYIYVGTTWWGVIFRESYLRDDRVVLFVQMVVFLTVFVTGSYIIMYIFIFGISVALRSQVTFLH